MTATDKNAAFWGAHGKRYDRATLFLNRRFPEIARMVAADLHGCERILEVAAGTGLITAEVGRSARTLVATDRSPEMLSLLRRRLHERGLLGVQVCKADVLALEFQDETFDAAVAGNLLHLLPDPGRALDELRRVVRPGGVLCAPTFAHGETPLAHAVSRMLAVLGFPVVWRFRGDQLRCLVERHGFSVFRDTIVRGILPVRYVVARRRTLGR